MKDLEILENVNIVDNSLYCGSAYPLFSFADNVVHSSEKYINSQGVTAQAPNLRPREQFVEFTSSFIEKLHEHCNEETLYIHRGGGMTSVKNTPVLGMITGGVRKFLSLFPKKEVTPYNETNLLSVNKWVNELTTHTEPKDIDKLLK